MEYKVETEYLRFGVLNSELTSDTAPFGYWDLMSKICIAERLEAIAASLDGILTELQFISKR